MLRQPKSKYEHKRSNTLLKVKTFYDAEARVVSHEPGKVCCTGLDGIVRSEADANRSLSRPRRVVSKDSSARSFASWKTRRPSSKSVAVSTTRGARILLLYVSFSPKTHDPHPWAGRHTRILGEESIHT
jgi:hypothetical protein